jgi:hypothetical protein
MTDNATPSQEERDELRAAIPWLMKQPIAPTAEFGRPQRAAKQ